MSGNDEDWREVTTGNQSARVCYTGRGARGFGLAFAIVGLAIIR